MEFEGLDIKRKHCFRVIVGSSFSRTVWVKKYKENEEYFRLRKGSLTSLQLERERETCMP